MTTFKCCIDLYINGLNMIIQDAITINLLFRQYSSLQ